MQESYSQYTIEYGEREIWGRAGEKARRLSRLLPWYALRGQVGASHGFLTLRDPYGNEIQEIHGASFSNRKKQISAPVDNKTVRETRLTYLRANFTKASSPVKTKDIPPLQLVAVIGDHSNAMLDFFAHPNSNRQVLFKGPKDEALGIWKKALLGAADINAANVPYVSFGILRPGQNCNSIARALIDRMGLSYDFKSPHVRLSNGRSLKALFTDRAAPDLCIETLAGMAMEKIAPHMQEAHERYATRPEMQEHAPQVYYGS